MKERYDVMKILSCVFEITPANPLKNAEKIMEICAESDADICLFPAYVLTGVACGNLLSYKPFAAQMAEAVDRLCRYTEEHNQLIVTATQQQGNIAVYDGDVNTSGNLTFGGKKVVISKNADEKADILLIPTAMPGYPCIKNDLSEFCAAASKKHGCVVAVANCGYGESSADNVFKGVAGIFKNGVITSFFAQDTPETISACADYEKGEGIIYARPKRPADKIPYYGINNPELYLDDLLLLQKQALYTRLKNCGIQKVGVNVSGGADSTLALLAAVETVKMMGLPASNVFAQSLPCFGTTSRTNSNARTLCETLGVTFREIDIQSDVAAHLKTIGHENSEDVTYENAQARERTQILLDICNKEGALALGTGDLSEEAIGFCTFGGDDLCHYNINATVPKTLVKAAISRYAEKPENAAVKEVLLDIVETPVSPELKNGQVTEDIVGPYLLIDFILYYFAKHHFSPEDIRNYMLATFDEYTDEEIDNALKSFFTRFKRNQFKRSSACEGANLLGVSLPYFPADAVPDFI